jgi:hypothetical protein
MVLLPLFIVVAGAVAASGQTQTFVSGTVTADTKRPVTGAIVGAGMSKGQTDGDGRSSSMLRHAGSRLPDPRRILTSCSCDKPVG